MSGILFFIFASCEPLNECRSKLLIMIIKLNNLIVVMVNVVRAQYVRMPRRPIRLKFSFFDQKISCSAQYVRMAMTLKILQVLIILPRKIYNFAKDNSTHGNFVQGQLDQRQFRPNSIVSVSTRIS